VATFHVHQFLEYSIDEILLSSPYLCSLLIYLMGRFETSSHTSSNESLLVRALAYYLFVHVAHQYSQRCSLLMWIVVAGAVFACAQCIFMTNHQPHKLCVSRVELYCVRWQPLPYNYAVAARIVSLCTTLYWYCVSAPYPWNLHHKAITSM